MATKTEQGVDNCKFWLKDDAKERALQNRTRDRFGNRLSVPSPCMFGEGLGMNLGLDPSKANSGRRVLNEVEVAAKLAALKTELAALTLEDESGYLYLKETLEKVATWEEMEGDKLDTLFNRLALHRADMLELRKLKRKKEKKIAAKLQKQEDGETVWFAVNFISCAIADAYLRSYPAEKMDDAGNVVHDERGLPVIEQVDTIIEEIRDFILSPKETFQFVRVRVQSGHLAHLPKRVTPYGQKFHILPKDIKAVQDKMSVRWSQPIPENQVLGVSIWTRK